MSTPTIQDVLIEPEEHVLSTLERDGSRRWLKPKLSPGRFWKRRRVVAYALIAIYTLIPFAHWFYGGRPLVLLDIPARRFTILGYTFLPTDTVLLALFMVGMLLTIFLLTALFGRVWCGWGCPQTVYLEFVFRPIERLLEGTAGRGGPKKEIAPWRVVVKYVLFFIVCLHLSNTFLSYFVGVDRMVEWTRQSPLTHPVPFLIVTAVSGLMMFDFCYFREQTCIIACPYGRFQSVLLDQNSLIVAYDEKRGEPRGKMAKGQTGLPVLGDCVDCKMCVTTCPTGIDIRKGLQMECINCTQCMDACDAVMSKIGRPAGLIRYSSQNRDRGGGGRLLRARTMIYPVLLGTIATIFVVVFMSQLSFNAVLLREAKLSNTATADGRVQNLLRLKLTNRVDEVNSFRVTVVEPAGAELHLSEASVALAPYATETFHLQVTCAKDLFRNGRAPLKLLVENDRKESREFEFVLLGPFR